MKAAHHRILQNVHIGFSQKTDKLEFGGESLLTMRARCCMFRYCPNPLGIVTAKHLTNWNLLFSI